MNIFKETYQHIRHFDTTFWLVIFAAFLNQCGNMAFVFLTLYLTLHLHFILQAASLLIAINSGTMLVTGLVCGNFIDRVGASRLMIVSLCINGLVLMLFPLLHHFTGLMVVCFIWGLTFGLFRPASQTFISYLSTPGLHKVTFSLYRLAMNLGMSIGPAVGGFLAKYSFTTIFFANAFANLLACSVLAYSFMNSTWWHYKSTSTKRPVLTIKWLFHDPMLRLFMLAMIPVTMVFFQHVSTLSLYLQSNLKLSLSFYGLLFTINTLMIVFFELLLNVATLKWPYRVNFVLGSLLIALGFGGLMFASNEAHIIFSTVIWTLGEMILFPAASSYVADIAPSENKGSYMALYSTATNFGILFGPLAGAMVMAHLGARGLWLSCGLWGFVSVLMFYYIQQPADVPAASAVVPAEAGIQGNTTLLHSEG